MTRLTALLCWMLIPASLFCQNAPTYEIPFGDLRDTGKALPLDNVELNSNNKDKAAIIIENVPVAEIGNIKLTFRSDPARIIPFERDANDPAMLTFKLKDSLDAADYKFHLLYKNHLSHIFQFGKVNQERANINGDGDGENGDDITTYLAALANANFVGNNKFLSNLTPVVNLGSIVELYKKSYGKPEKDANGNIVKDANGKDKKRGLFNWRLDINPYIGGQIDTKDSASFIPALMLGGRAGLTLNNYLSWGNENVEFTWMPLGYGLKIIPDLQDSATNVWQHNFRAGISLKYKDIFIIGGQYTYGFHNTTSQSKEYFKKVFSSNSTDIQYLTLTGQFFVKSAKEESRNNYLFVEWRGLLNKKAYEGFNNIAIITVGFRKDLVLTNTFAAAVSTSANAASTGKIKVTRKRRPSIF